jgi:hypothetical protein
MRLEADLSVRIRTHRLFCDGGHAVRQKFARSATCAGLLLLCLFLSGCPGSVYLWEVRTESTARPPSFNPAVFEQQPVAVLEALTAPGLHGNEVGLALSLSRILKRVQPKWRLVSPQETATRINQRGLAAEYARMRMDYEQSNLLDREPLRKIGAAIGARYVFQPRLAAFTQTLYDRWKVPALEINVVRIRSSILRLSLQLWDTETGELIWASTAEATFQEEAVSEDPVYFREAGRITWATIIADFTHGETSSKYTSVNTLLDSLISDEGKQEPQQKKP